MYVKLPAFNIWLIFFSLWLICNSIIDGLLTYVIWRVANDILWQCLRTGSINRDRKSHLPLANETTDCIGINSSQQPFHKRQLNLMLMLQFLKINPGFCFDYLTLNNLSAVQQRMSAFQHSPLRTPTPSLSTAHFLQEPFHFSLSCFCKAWHSECSQTQPN